MLEWLTVEVGKSLLVKRLLDVVCAILGLLITIPFLLPIVLILKAFSGSVFFKQLRVGCCEKRFNILKFTTMFVGSEQHGTVTTKDDPRITPIGRFLRKYKINELPQLINVLKGEMSFVGPRPLPLNEVLLFSDQDREIIFRVKPGITGITALNFINEDILLSKYSNPQEHYKKVVLPKKIELERQYVENWNLISDIKIFWLTIFKLIKLVLK